jgi:hypothetical protein
VAECSKEEIAEAVALELTLVEAVLEELCEEVLVLRERDHAIADVAGRKDVQFVAKPPGGAAIVGDGDYGGKFADGMVCGVSISRGCVGTYAAAAVTDGNVLLEAAQKRGEAGTATDGDDAQRPLR